MRNERRALEEVTVTKSALTGSFELIKNLNTACILNIMRENGVISRADIARKSGLTPATVSNITSELIDLGLVVETERGESSGGRKPVLLTINAQACRFAGVHISSTKLEVAVLDVEAEILWHEKMPLSPGAQHDDVLESAIGLIRKAVDSGAGPISGIGVCQHGLVRSEEGLLVFAPNFGWENVRVGDTLANEFGLPVVLENDVRAMTLAESWCGCAKGVRNCVYLYIGPGIGGSIMLDGELYQGDGGFAGEFGHNTIEPEGPLCSCGNSGCLQAVASETTMLKNYLMRKACGPDTTFATLLADVRNGDPVASEIVFRGIRYIGMEIGNIINSLSPSLIVLNGSITTLGGMVMTAIDDEVRRRCLKYSQSRTRIVFSRLGEGAQMKGAAACVIRELFAHPRRFLNA